MSVKRLDRRAERTAHLFAALGDRTRLRLVVRLASSEPLSISRLSAGARMTRQAVTKHLHVLEKAGVARGRRRGRERLWELNPAELREARRCLDRIARQWEDALDRLKAAVESAL
jgi:DNA-binding transcriptional ArsR family regulator